MDRDPALRLLVAHALGATAVALPWPSLLAGVATSGDDVQVGLTGAARLLPYVLLSALAGALADRVDRTVVLRWSAASRTALVVGSALAASSQQVGVAVLLAALAVATTTPAYPAAVAALPGLAHRRTDRWTAWLVTAEVTAFVVGPALGGILLGLGVGTWAAPCAALLGAVSFWLLGGLPPSPVPARVPGTADGPGRFRVVLRSPGVAGVVTLVALVNFVASAAAVALLRLSADRWHAGDEGFGVATAALGLGAVAAPLVRHLVARAGALRAAGGGLVVAGATPSAALAAAPLAVVGAASTVVECVATETLQRSVPDRFRAFSLGLTDAVMVSAAALGALVGPTLVAALGAVPAFGALGVLLVAASLPVPTPLRRAVPAASRRRRGPRRPGRLGQRV